MLSQSKTKLPALRSVSFVYRLSLLQALQNFLTAGLLAVLYVPFHQENISLPELMLAEALGAFAVPIWILLRGKVQTRKDMLFGFLLIGIGLILLLFPFSRPVFYFYTLLRSIGNVVFFTAYNVLYFANPNSTRLLRSMTYYWTVNTFAGVIGPLVGGYLLAHANLYIFVIVALTAIAGALILIRKAPSQSNSYTSHELLTHLKKLRTITVLNGSLHRIVPAVSILAVLYVNEVTNYGKLLSLMALIAVPFSLFIAKRSDQNNERMKYLWPISIIAAATTMLFTFSTTTISFVILLVILRGATVMADPIRVNVMQDAKDPHALNWISREFYLNIGRALFFFVIALFLNYSFAIGIYVLMSLLQISFPILVSHKKIYQSKKYFQTVDNNH